MPVDGGCSHKGLSPRARGNPLHRRRGRPGTGSIPAGAGEPRGSCSAIPPARVYPRGRGGTHGVKNFLGHVRGLSPRARGNLPNPCERISAGGSIPAGAGEPSSCSTPPGSPRVYPRGRGGTVSERARASRTWGLSPRARGNQPSRTTWRPCAGSIPAGAGEPQTSSPCPPGAGVYPRGRGGTHSRGSPQCLHSGLSPRARGEPRGPDRAVRGTGVYPRGRGGTTIQSSPSQLDVGLSPRARGNRRAAQEAGDRLGSIPAGAGEPMSCACSARSPGVYPRGRGGTFLNSTSSRRVKGLSPRARGNRRPQPRAAAKRGSIPAGAGEPIRRPTSPRRARVYPRGRGGTVSGSVHGSTRPGLSPRARGNRGRSRARDQGHGSIPAGAGEPSRRSCLSARRRVYPRGRGGTKLYGMIVEHKQGLSPRARGNQYLPGRRAEVERSIPAGAGEPFVRHWTSLLLGVYPRGRGGTLSVRAAPVA